MVNVIIPPPDERTRTQFLLLEKIRIDPGSLCWEWTDHIHPESGYGKMRVPGEGMVEAHRVAFEHFTEDGIPDDCEDMRHRCPEMSNSCCNPHHLTPGTKAENQIDAILDGGRDVRFSPSEIREIRQRYEHCDISQAELGDEYGVSQVQIGKIVRREDYTHVPPADESDDEYRGESSE